MDSITVTVARRLIPFDLKEDQKNELIASMSLELNGPEPISKTTFLKLQKLAEDLDLSVAMGQECTDGFDEVYAEVSRLLDESKWTLHPDYGCVSVEEARKRDQEAI